MSFQNRTNGVFCSEKVLEEEKLSVTVLNSNSDERKTHGCDDTGAVGESRKMTKESETEPN